MAGAGHLKNIILLSDYASANGGAARVAVDSAAGLAGMGYRVVFFAAVGPADEALAGKAEVCLLGQQDISRGFALRRAWQGIWNREARRRLAALLRMFNPADTIVHIHGFSKALSASVFQAVRRSGYRCFLTLHDYFAACPNGGFYDYRQDAPCTLEPMSLKCILCSCDKRSYAQKLWRVARQAAIRRCVTEWEDLDYISISRLNRRLMEGRVASGRIHEVPNPVRLADKHVLSAPSRPKFLYVGRISREKGADLFCRAAEELLREEDGPSFDAAVAGSGDGLGELEEACPHVRFLGWLAPEQVQEELAGATALVFPTRCYEGAPLAILEALSAGIPCIVSDVSSAVEVIRDGYNGYIFRAGSALSLKEKMRAMLKDPGDDLRENIVRMDLGAYRAEHHCRSLVRIYEEALLGSRRGEAEDA